MPEHSRWPLLARPELIELLLHGMQGRLPSPALVTGLAGAGKTTLLHELGARLRARHRRVMTLHGVAELSTVPLGAFLPLLTGTTDPEATVEVRLRVLLDRLGRDTDRTVLLVDDASHLDDMSAAAVYQLIRAFGLPVVLSARSGETLPPALDRLHHEGSLVTRTVPPLTHDEAAELLRRRLGGTPTPELLNTLWARTEGNPLFLRGLVEGALNRSRPEHTPHGFDLDIDAVADIGALADRAIDALTPGARRAAQLLALTGGLDAGELARADSPMAVGLLRDAGLTTTAEQGRVRLVHPLIADAARRSLGDDRIRIATEAARLLDEGDDSRRLAAVRLLLASGVQPDSGRLAEAAATAARAGDHRGCDELAAAASASGAEGAELRWTRAASLSLLGRLDEADTVFAEGWLLARTASERALGVSRNGEHLALRRHDIVGALTLAEQQLKSLPAPLQQELEPEVRIWQAIAGQLGNASSPGVADPGIPPSMRMRSAMARVLTESLAGRNDLARAAAEAIAAIDREFGALDPVASAMMHLEGFFHHLARADGAAAWGAVERQRSGPLTDAAGLWSYTLGVFCWYDGRVSEGERLARLAVVQLRWRDPTGLLGAAITLQALLTQAAGHGPEAARLISELVPEQLNEPRAAMLFAEYSASQLAESGHHADACALLARAGGRAVDDGYGLVGALTLSLAIRLGQPAMAIDGLTRAASAGGADNLLLPALRDLASALIASDIDGVLAAAQVVGRAGMRATARDALVLAADATGISAESHRRLLRTLDDLRVDMASGPSAPTARERAVAHLVAQRLSNDEIAEEMGVSVRTVENHLTRYYAKTGTTRAQLRASVVPAG